jgi:hypothetical protein
MVVTPENFGLVRNAEGGKSVHFLACGRWTAVKQLLDIGCVECAVFFEQWRKTLDRMGEALSNVSSIIGHKSSLLICRRPQIRA